MNKIDYLKFALANNCFHKKAWIVSCFAAVKEDPQEATVDTYTGKVIKQAWGYSFINAEGKLEPIDNIKSTEIIFRFKDVITIDSSWCSNVKEPIQTTIGNLLFNHISILPIFKNKMDFMTGKISVTAIEDKIAPLLTDTPAENETRKSDVFYVDEYVAFVDSLQFLSNLSEIVSWSCTAHNLVAPPGIKEFKQELLKKYEGKLTDPVELSKFERELLAYDAAYLKDDISDGNFISGKIKNIARKKMFLSLGAEQLTFDNSPKARPVINSLEEGWDLEPENYTAVMNGLRIGSFARGSETVKGGVSAKILLRAANSFKIVDSDCNSKLGIHRVFDETNIHQLVGRYIIEGKLSLIENKSQAANYLSKPIVVRSPMYCKLEGDNICKVCAGMNLFQYPTGVTIPLTEISSIILGSFMAAMHAKELTTSKMQLSKAFT